ncbi:MAG: hydrogenase nickel incorporation protein HypB [Kiritimatiellae bacterium]|nr:hydrogenase nickel incorporation protein HypB [Kiritimatiellia bacterium]
MCETCGCSNTGGEASARAGAAADHHHHHEHPHSHVHAHSPEGEHGARRRIQVGTDLLAVNAEIAARNRAWLDERGVVAFNLISAPGSGKTLLLERTLDRLRDRVGCAVITGDVRTDRDARRLEGRGAQVHQIETLSACHLNAEQVRRCLPQVIKEDTRLLFIENVGNLVCPAAFDLGEHLKVALLSVTEGEDKPLKYPAVFAAAGMAIITKLDLAAAVGWDRAACLRALRSVHPGLFILELSARTGEGMDTWIEYLVRAAG